MNSSRNRNGDTRRPFIMAVACLALLLLTSLVASAQTTTVTPTPDKVTDATKPPSVELRLANPAVVDQVTKVRVGDQDVTQLQKNVPAQGSITFTPPAGLNGPQKVELRDSQDKPLGQTQLTYPGTGGGSNASGNRSGNTSGNTDGNGNGNVNAVSERAEARRDLVAGYNWFYFIVTAMFLLLLVPFVFTIVRAIRFSRSTFNSPLGLPVGSFRAILAYTLVVYLGFYVLVSILSVSEFQPPQFLLGIVATVIGFYFGSRGEEAAADAKPGSVQGVVTKPDNSPAPQAAVVLSQAGVEKGKATTDASGKYTIDNVAPGNYDIVASLAGTQPSDPAKVRVTGGAAQTKDLKLK